MFRPYFGASHYVVVIAGAPFSEAFSLRRGCEFESFSPQLLPDVLPHYYPLSNKGHNGHKTFLKSLDHILRIPA